MFDIIDAMQKEPDPRVVRGKVTLETEGADMNRVHELFVAPIIDRYKDIVSADLAKTEPLLLEVINANVKSSSAASPSYCLARYLDITREGFFERRAVRMINNPLEFDKDIAAVFLDINSGFLRIIWPILLAHEEESSMSKAAEDTFKEWREYRKELDSDPTGCFLVARQSEIVKNASGKLVENEIKEFVAAGANLASEMYQEYYPTTVQMIQNNDQI